MYHVCNSSLRIRIETLLPLIIKHRQENEINLSNKAKITISSNKRKHATAKSIPKNQAKRRNKQKLKTELQKEIKKKNRNDDKIRKWKLTMKRRKNSESN